LHYLRRIQTTVFPKQPDFDLYARKNELQCLNGELIRRAATMEKMGGGEPTNEDLVDQMQRIMEDFESQSKLFCIELEAR
jgi:hypothetical protein